MKKDDEFGTRRSFLAGIGTSAAVALAGCTGNGSSASNGADNGSNAADAVEFVNNDVETVDSVTQSTLTIENTAEEAVEFTVSVNLLIGVDGIYGDLEDSADVSIPGGDRTEVTLELYDGDDLSRLAVNEIQNGYFSLTYFVDGTETSFQEFGEKPRQYVSFRVLYGGEWSGSLGTEGGQRSISGVGDSHLPVDNSASIVSGNAQKRDGGGSGELTVQILVDGAVRAEQSTTAEYGVAQVSESI
ncbi:hypothetical protein [Halobaculum rubrum]|uniref:hypothetical protein n=1 Tax=Halobaculum rubrum TaxID=2872158 RepID=UPI001CA3C21E|nr:hypothetical protein [Halobaculum rubrum]QZX98489.1 hypothetical protein K6T25_09350 [Halobaculum rubrum]